MVKHLAVAHAHAAAGLVQHIGGIGHGFHATGNDDVVGAGLDGIEGEHGGLHAGATQLIDGGGTGVVRQTGQTHGLTGRALFEASGQYTAHDDFLHVFRLQAGAGYGFTDRGGAQFGSGNRRQGTLEPTHGGTGTIYNYYSIIRHGFLLPAK